VALVTDGRSAPRASVGTSPRPPGRLALVKRGQDFDDIEEGPDRSGRSGLEATAGAVPKVAGLAGQYAGKVSSASAGAVLSVEEKVHT
jgi:hypothetical protein